MTKIMRRILRSTYVGIGITIIILVGTVIYTWIYGPLYGRWGWAEVSAALLILAVCGLAGLEALLRQPNPYTRTYALYNMMDIAPHDSLQGEGFSWMIQAVPALISAAILIMALLLL